MNSNDVNVIQLNMLILIWGCFDYSLIWITWNREIFKSKNEYNFNEHDSIDAIDAATFNFEAEDLFHLVLWD